MKKISAILAVLIFASGLFAQMSGKRPTRFGFDLNVKPAIFYDIYISVNRQTLRPQINFRISIQNDLLYFIKHEEGYAGGYDIALMIKDTTTNSTVFSQLWREKIFEEDFENTNSRDRYQISSKSFPIDLEPKKYTAILTLTDEASGNSFTSNRRITISEEKNTFYYSEIKILTQEKDLSAEIILEDKIPKVEFNKDLKAHFELLGSFKVQPALSSTLFYLEDNKEIEIKNQHYTPEVDDSLLVFEENLDNNKLREGNYLLRYNVSIGETAFEVNKKFEVVWYKKPIYLYDVELAIKPLHYILSVEEKAQIKKLEGERLSDWFEKYWREKDPDPETIVNEIQLEFYQRVMKADRKYIDSYNEGWKTDRGKTIILYGDPDRTEQSRYSTKNKPYEIWYYTKLNKKLVFIDVNEDESYHLMSIESIGDNIDE